MQRRFIDYLIIALKGMAMGAADAVPGVSGGTIAFISGIYEELITSISNINLSLFKTLKTKGISAFWKATNGNFLLSLFLGIIISLFSFLKLAKYLLEHHPILIWSFFFGLIVASILFIGKQINKWNVITISTGIIGAFVAFYITTLPPMGNTDSSFFLFFAGALAICAMILPGISGAFILVILGAYKTVSDAVDDMDLKKIIIFGMGTIVGLLSFSRLLKWLFKNYQDITLALLSGFILGSLNKVWPWKQILTFRTNSKGLKVPLDQQSISPFSFAELNHVEHQLTSAIVLMILGFLTIFILEKVGAKKTE